LKVISTNDNSSQQNHDGWVVMEHVNWTTTLSDDDDDDDDDNNGGDDDVV